MRRLTIVFDPDSRSQSEAAHLVIRTRSKRFSVTANQIRALEALSAPSDSEDFVVLMASNRAGAMRSLLGRSPGAARLVAVFADEWPDGVRRFQDCYREADFVLMEDEHLWRRLGCLPNTHWMPLGMDDAVFRPTAPPECRGRRLLWLPPFSLTDPRVHERWRADHYDYLAGIGFEGEVPLPTSATSAERAEFFNRIAVVVCASSAPDAYRTLREAAACGCATVVTRSANRIGSVREGVTGVVVESGGDAMLSGIQRAYEHRAMFAQNVADANRTTGWSSFGQRVFDLLDGLSRNGVAAPSRPNLTGAVTVFVSTIGAPSVHSCLDHLSQQDCEFGLEVIRDVAPMSAAFQHMVDACRTPFYVQVDEDMLLYPDAIRQLYLQIQNAPANVALVVAYLYDVHLGEPVQGVKIFRHEVVKRYPLEDVRCCEIDQVDRMRADGYAYLVMPLDSEGGPNGETKFPFRVLGLHGTHYSPQTIFERFRTLELARHKHPRKLRHQEAWPAMLIERFLDRGDPLDFYGLMGLVSGARSLDVIGREKNFHNATLLPGFEAACRFLNDVTDDDGPVQTPTGPVPTISAPRRGS